MNDSDWPVGVPVRVPGGNTYQWVEVVTVDGRKYAAIRVDGAPTPTLCPMGERWSDELLSTLKPQVSDDA